MPIQFDAKRGIFHLQTCRTSYVIHLIRGRWLQHVFWGKRVEDYTFDSMKQYGMSSSKEEHFTKDEWTLDMIAREYPSYGSSDLRSPAVQIVHEDGASVSEFIYESHRIFAGKTPLEGLPATYTEEPDEAQTLEITLRDPVDGMKAVLSYTVFDRFDAITRSVRLVNEGKQKVKLLRALSANVDFDDKEFDMLHLSGSWAHERQIVKRRLAPGEQSIESRRGFSSHQQNPFLALARPGATEQTGEVYGFSLVYSGDFLANIEVDQNNISRVQMGINPFDFTWTLAPGESFQTPEAVLVFSENGFGGMSRIYHDLYRQRLCRGKYRDCVRPILVNNWEATYFRFDEEKLLKIARSAKDLGIEMLVLDDGWFGRRDADNSSLGDWVPDRHKLPNGLDGLASKVNDLGLKFGLWFEPEMVSPDSDLYRAHPDWCMHVNGHASSLGRHQLVLDLTRKEVQDYIISSVENVLSSANIEYVKWDCNRYFSEVGSGALPADRQRETVHRYTLALYHIMDTITSDFPDVLFEGCAGGGGRFDPGILYYMPQIWASDMTDAVERQKIQYGTSLVYPAVATGSHVSDVPNGQNGRVTPMRTRGDCAMGGCFGYELDLSSLGREDLDEIRAQVEYVKAIRAVVQFGDQYRLLNPFELNECAWMFVAKDGSTAVVSYFRTLAVLTNVRARFRLQGLAPDAQYRVIPRDGAAELHGGDELMNIGLTLPKLHGDFASCTWKLEKV